MNKKSVDRETFPDSVYESWNGPPSYEELIESLGVEIYRQKTFGSYQGDVVMILKDTYSNNREYVTRYGFLIFGYGSCSGCDSLRACSSFKDVEEIRNQLESQIKWFDNDMESGGLTKLENWMKKHDWKGDYIGSCFYEIGDCKHNKKFGEKLFKCLMEKKDA